MRYFYSRVGVTGVTKSHMRGRVALYVDMPTFFPPFWTFGSIGWCMKLDMSGRRAGRGARGRAAAAPRLNSVVVGVLATDEEKAQAAPRLCEDDRRGVGDGVGWVTVGVTSRNLSLMSVMFFSHLKNFFCFQTIFIPLVGLWIDPGFAHLEISH